MLGLSERSTNVLWRAVTLGRSTRVWIDQERLARLRAAVAYVDELEREAEGLERESARIKAEAERIRGEIVARRALALAGVPDDEHGAALAIATASAPPLNDAGGVDEARMTERVHEALAALAVDELLEYLFHDHTTTQEDNT